MKKVLCYLALVVLVILIILPPALRIFVKDDGSDAKPKDVVELLSCKKSNESISMPYKNGALTSIKYTVVDNGDNNVTYGTLRNILMNIGNTHTETIDGKITYRLDMTVQNNALRVPDVYKGTSEIMKDYYTRLGYSCNIMK